MNSVSSLEEEQVDTDYQMPRNGIHKIERVGSPWGIVSREYPMSQEPPLHRRQKSLNKESLKTANKKKNVKVK